MKEQFSKLWAISFLLIITFAALIYWGIRSYQESSNALERLTKPDSKAELLNSIFKYVYQTDLHFNNFILTNDSLQQKDYQFYTQKIDSSVTILLSNINQNNEELVRQIDSLKTIIQEKTNLNNTLINLKKRQNSQFFVNEALNRIKNQLSDSTYIESLLTEQQEVIVKQDTIDVLEVLEIPDDYKGISGFFRRLFGVENVRTDTVLSQDVKTSYNLAITEKRRLIRDYSKDSTLLVVKTILLDVLNDEIAFQKKLVDAELEMIVYNELLLQNIRALLEDISLINQTVLIQEKESASEKIQSAHQSAFFVAGIGIFLGLVLLTFLFKDISQAATYRKRLEIEKERAEELALAKESFLSSMSHEIRTPLHSIAGLSQLLAKEFKKKGKAHTLINGIMYANQYLRELIENILEQAKINTGNYRIEYHSIHIPELAKELKQLFAYREMEQNNEFHVEYDDSFNTQEILFDEIKLKQVLINLIGNAFKFTKNGHIRVYMSLDTSLETNQLHIEVSDTGIGIAPRFHDSIFEAFNQGESSTTTSSFHGTGLGLSITKHILSQAGGTIRVTSEPQKGSTFIIDLPVEVAFKTEPSNNRSIELQAFQFYPIRVLAVEDDEWNSFLLREYVQPHVKELLVYNDARQALPYLKEHPHELQLILTDLNLPGLSGTDFFEHIQSIHSIPVIALSASMSKKQRLELIEQGFYDALGKPFTEQELLAILNRLFQPTASKKPIDSNNEPNSTSKNTPNLEVFQRFYSQKCEAFQHALEQEDVSELARLAHQLKSNTEQVGFNHLSESLQSIEVFHSTGNKQRVIELSKEILPKLFDISEQLDK